MDNHSYANEEPEVKLSLVEILWDLLSQWKAILAVALVMALVIPGVKLLRDSKAYAAMQAQAADEETEVMLPTDEAIEQALTALPTGDRDAIEMLIQQQSLIEAQTEYLQTSLLLNSDPVHQRNLTLRYYLTTDGSVEVQALLDAYAALLKQEQTLARLAETIDHDTSTSNIGELITIGTRTTDTIDSNAKELVMTVSIALPERVDASAVLDVFDSCIMEIYAQLNEVMGAHNIMLLSHNESFAYNEGVVTRKANLISSINSNRAAITAAVAALNTDQQAAFATITNAMDARDHENTSGEGFTDNATATADDEAAKPVSPTFSLKYAVVGFAVGIVLYAIAYVVLVVMRGQIMSGGELSDYTKSRLLGDVYYPVKYTGLSKLLHSKMVSRYRYGNKGSVDAQLEKTASTIDSVCEHAGVNNVHMLYMASTNAEARHILDGIVSNLATKGIEAQIVNVAADVDEKTLLPIRNAIYYVDGSIKGSDIWKLASLCCSYDIAQLGSVFVKSW